MSESPKYKGKVLIVVNPEDQRKFTYLDFLLAKANIEIIRTDIGKRLEGQEVNPQAILLVDDTRFHSTCLFVNSALRSAEIEELLAHYGLTSDRISVFDTGLFTLTEKEYAGIPTDVMIFGIDQDEEIAKEMIDTVELSGLTEDELVRMGFKQSEYRLNVPTSKINFQRDLIHLREREQSVVTVRGDDSVRTIWWMERVDYEKRRGKS